jgi:hypothetical protein
MLAGCIVCIAAFIWAYTSKTDRLVFGSDCNIVMPGIKGTFCQAREADGTIYYYNKKIKVVVMK